MKNRKWGRIVAAALTAGTMALVTACGGGSSTSESTAGAGEGAIAQEIKLGAVHDLTGPVAYAGVGAKNGAEIAIEEINSSAFLGQGVTLSIEEVDTAFEIERATSEMTKMMGNREIMAIIGPAASQQAAAVAPLIERQKVPTVFTQSGSSGVVIGDWTFRGTAPMETYYKSAVDWQAAQGLTDTITIYNAQFPTYAQLADTHFPELAQASGITIGNKIAVQTNTQDFTGPAQQIAQANPKAVNMFLLAPQSVTFLNQLRQAGYTGQVIGTSVQGAGNIAPAGEAANGLVYPTDFSYAQTEPKAVAFTQAYEAKFGKKPDNYAAEGYDSIWWIARAIKASGDSSREGIQKGLQQVAGVGFEGAMGNLTFEGNDMRVPGVMIRWDGSAETLAE